MPVNISVLQLLDQGVISAFKSYYLRNTFLKAIAAIDSDSSNGSEQNKWKILWERFIILDAIEKICDSSEEIKISTLVGVWKKLIPILMDDFEGSRRNLGLRGGINYRCDENGKRTELEVEPKHVTALLNVMIKLKGWRAAFYG